MSEPVFLIGTQRSGTTLLARMLTAHPEIFIKNEVPVAKVFQAEFSRDQILTEIDNAIEGRHEQTLTALLASEGKTVWGLKDPQLTEYLDVLAKHFGQARFIIIVRDARAVVRSYIENAWGLGTNCYSGALRWQREVDAQLQFEKKMPNVLRLHYEELIANQQHCMQMVCEFLNVNYDASMLRYYESKSFVNKNRQSVNTFSAPDAKKTVAWRDELSEHQVKVINHVCSATLVELGYIEKLQDEALQYVIPGWLKCYYRLHQAVIGEIQIQYRWRIAVCKRLWQRWSSKWRKFICSQRG